ncbi:WD40 repeat domain-containing protein, partial [Candidatus Dependentiae bacterium]
VDWSPNGKYVALGTSDLRGGKHLKIFKSDGEVLSDYFGFDLGMSATVKDIAWHPYGDHIAIATESIPDVSDISDAVRHEVKIFELKSTGLEELTGCYRVGTGQSSSIETVESVAWSPDGDFIISAGYGPSQQAKIYAFDYAYSLSELSSISVDFGSSSTIYSVDWVSTGTYSTIACVGEAGPGNDRIKLYGFGYDEDSTDTHVIMELPNAHFETCNTRFDVAWSPDGTKLAAVGWDGLEGSEVMAFKYSNSSETLEHLALCDFVHSGTVFSVDWSPDSSMIAVTGNTFVEGSTHSRVLKFTEKNSFEEVTQCRVSEAGGAGRSVKWSPDGFSLVTSGTISGDGAGLKIKSLDFQSLNDYTLTNTKELRLSLPLSSPPSFSNNIEEVEWSHDSRYLAAVTTDNDLIVYSFDGSTFTQKDTESFGSNLAAVAWHPDRKHIFICGGDGTDSKNIRLYTFEDETLALVNSFDPGTVTMRDISVHPGGTFVVIALDSEVRLYSFNPATSTFNDTHLQSVSHGGVVYGTQWSPSGRYVLLSGADAAAGNYNVRVYEFDGSSTLTALSGCNLDLSITSALAGHWSFDEKYVALACSSDGVKILSFDGTTLTLETTVNLSALDLSWSHDNLFIALSGASYIRCVKFQNDNWVEMDGAYKTQSDGNINSVHFSPDDRFLAAGGAGSDKFECYATNFETTIEANSNSIVGMDGVFDRVISNSDSIALVLTNSDALVTLDTLQKANSESVMSQGSELYEMRLGSVMSGCTKNTLATVYSVDWSPNVDYLAVGHANASAQDDNVNVRVYSFDNYTETLTELPDCKKLHGNSVTGVSWRPDGEFLAVTGLPDGSNVGVRVYKLIGRRLSQVATATIGRKNFLESGWKLFGHWVGRNGRARS